MNDNKDTLDAEKPKPLKPPLQMMQENYTCKKNKFY